jgi:hypothetical protein
VSTAWQVQILILMGHSSKDPQISMMRAFFKTPLKDAGVAAPSESTMTAAMEPTPDENRNFADLVNYPSDLSSDHSDSLDMLDNGVETSPTDSDEVCHSQPIVPLRKRQRLDIPYRVQREQKRKQRLDDLENAFKDLEKLLKAKKTKFVGGVQGLQARRARTMESHLRLIVKNAQQFTSASKQAAETHGFAANWGGRQVRSWTRQWMKTRELPKSMQGHHAKVYYTACSATQLSLLNSGCIFARTNGP